MTEEKKYNGWINRETWCFHLWLTSDEALYALTRNLLMNLKQELEIEPLFVIHDAMIVDVSFEAAREFTALIDEGIELEGLGIFPLETEVISAVKA